MLFFSPGGDLYLLSGGAEVAEISAAELSDVVLERLPETLPLLRGDFRFSRDAGGMYLQQEAALSYVPLQD